jgi:hypothetical protein
MRTWSTIPPQDARSGCRRPSTPNATGAAALPKLVGSGRALTIASA